MNYIDLEYINGLNIPQNYETQQNIKQESLCMHFY